MTDKNQLLRVRLLFAALTVGGLLLLLAGCGNDSTATAKPTALPENLQAQAAQQADIGRRQQEMMRSRPTQERPVTLPAR